jgi:hypothetical protein
VIVRDDDDGMVFGSTGKVRKFLMRQRHLVSTGHVSEHVPCMFHASGSGRRLYR